MSEGKTLVLTSNNILYGVGVNKFALGFDNLEPKIKELTQIPPSNYNYEKIVAVAPAFSCSVVATEQSNLYVLGQNVLHPADCVSRPSTRIECPEICKGGKKIVDMQCGYYHVGILNSAGEVYLGGDFYGGKLGFLTDRDYYGMKKYVSEHIFCSISIVGNSSYLAATNGKLIAFGELYGLFYGLSDGWYKTLQFPSSVEQMSARNEEIVVCTSQGEVYCNVKFQATSLLCKYDVAYNVISEITDQSIFICLSTERNIVLGLPLMKHVMHRKELQDLIVLIVA